MLETPLPLKKDMVHIVSRRNELSDLASRNNAHVSPNQPNLKRIIESKRNTIRYHVLKQDLGIGQTSH